jgi:hypothetical protein
MSRVECTFKPRIYVRDNVHLNSARLTQIRSRDGRNLSFFQVLGALSYVYNLSYPLALLLTFAGFITCGTISFGKNPMTAAEKSKFSESKSGSSAIAPYIDILLSLPSYLPRVTLDLGSLSKRGFFKIAHNASLVHPRDVESASPHPGLVALFIATACRNKQNSASLVSIARFHAARLRNQPIDSVHESIARGECALAFLVLRGTYPKQDPLYVSPGRARMSPRVGRNPEAQMEMMKVNRKVALERFEFQGAVPAERMEQWFGEERLPDEWWLNSEEASPGVRSIKTIGLIQTARAAYMVGQVVDQAVVLSAKERKPMDTPVIKYSIS